MVMLIRGVQCSYGGCLNIPAHLAFFMEAEKQHLSMGSSGTDVKNMQKKLIALGYSCGSSGADGIFGQGTYNAVCKFQKANGLSVDGIIGPATRAKINALYAKL